MPARWLHLPDTAAAATEPAWLCLINRGTRWVCRARAEAEPWPCRPRAAASPGLVVPGVVLGLGAARAREAGSADQVQAREKKEPAEVQILTREVEFLRTR